MQTWEKYTIPAHLRCVRLYERKPHPDNFFSEIVTRHFTEKPALVHIPLLVIPGIACFPGASTVPLGAEGNP